MRMRRVFAVAAALVMTGAAHAQSFAELAKSSGTPQIPGLKIVYLSALGNPAAARFKHILVHQTEGPAGSAKNGAAEQNKNPTKRGVMIWVETDGTVYFAVPETVVTLQGDGANRNDNKYIDNSTTFRTVVKENTVGIEFAGNFPDVTKGATPEQAKAWPILVRFLQERYTIRADKIFAHNWIDYKDARYCEGCELATLARQQNYVPTGLAKW